MSIRLAIGLTALATCAAGAFEAAQAAPAGQSLPRLAAECDVATRDAPTLDVKRLPSARFRMVDEPIGWGRDASGKQFELMLRHGEETATLEDGVKLGVSLGGCEDYSNQYEFSIPGRPPASAEGAYWLRRASALLREVEPANRDELLPLKPLADALTRSSRDPQAARNVLRDGLEGAIEGREDTTYLVVVEPRGDGSVLRVNYWIDL